MPVSQAEWVARMTNDRRYAEIEARYGEDAATAYKWLHGRPSSGHRVQTILHNAFDTGPRMVGNITTTADGEREEHIIDRSDKLDNAKETLANLLDQMVEDGLLVSRDIHMENGVKTHYRCPERDLTDALIDD